MKTYGATGKVEWAGKVEFGLFKKCIHPVVLEIETRESTYPLETVFMQKEKHKQ